MHLALLAHDHIVHFYHLHALDWVDIISALKADPHATSTLAQSISSWPLSSPGYYRPQTRLKRSSNAASSAVPNGYWGSKAYKLPPEANLMAVAHYLEALDFQKDMVQIQTIFGGKNPHPNWLVGGVPCPINLDGVGAIGAINMERLNLVDGIIDRVIEFNEKVYLPDVVAIGSFYKDWAARRRTVEFARSCPMATCRSTPTITRRAICCCRMASSSTATSTKFWPSTSPTRTRSRSSSPIPGTNTPTRPRACIPGTASPRRIMNWGRNPRGRRPRFANWTRAANIRSSNRRAGRDIAMEVGPLARFAIGHAQNNPEFKEPVDKLLKDLDLPNTALFSTLGRTAARALEAQWAGDKLRHFYDKLIASLKAGDTATADTMKWEPSTWPAECKGVGFAEAPRGALGHWLKIKHGKIDNYQCVVPTTWNGSPRDPPAPSAPSRRRCSARRWPIPSSRSKSCARSTPSTPASPARRM